LTRFVGDDFLSVPILSIPAAITKAELGRVTFVDFNVIRTRAGGKVRLQRTPTVTDPAEFSEVTVRGRVLFLFAQALANAATGTSSDTTRADLVRKITRVNRIWAQAGIEVKTRTVAAPVEAPAELLDVEHTDNTGVNLTTEEQRLCGRLIKAGDPTRSTVATDLNVFYVRSLDKPPTGADPAGIAYPNDPVIIVEGGLNANGNPKTKDEALAHEIGHQVIDWGGRDEHRDLSGVKWPTTNVLHEFDTGGDVVDRTQVIDIINSTNAGTNGFVIFEP
jgi:hypothetical protein